MADKIYIACLPHRFAAQVMGAKWQDTGAALEMKL